MPAPQDKLITPGTSATASSSKVHAARNYIYGQRRDVMNNGDSEDTVQNSQKLGHSLPLKNPPAEAVHPPRQFPLQGIACLAHHGKHSFLGIGTCYVQHAQAFKR